MSHDRREEVRELIIGGISESRLARKMKFWWNVSDKLSLEWARGAICCHPRLEEQRIKREETQKNDKKTIRREPFGGVEDADYL